MCPPDDFNGSASRHAGKGVNAPLDKEGRTALHIAVEQQDAEGLSRLIRVGANPNQKNKAGQSAIYEAITRRRAKMIGLLVEKGASLTITDDAKRRPLDWAIEQGCDVPFIARLVELGADIGPGENKRTALHLAAQKNRADLVTFFAGLGADVNAQDKDGRTPLHAAVEGKALPALQKLLELGADAIRRDSDIKTPLHLAAAGGFAEGAKALLAEPDVRRTVNDYQTYSKGFTPLLEAVNANQPAIAAQIVAAGGDVNATDNQRRHSLFVAVETGAVDCARLLISLGADVSKGPEAGYNKLHLIHAVSGKAFRPLLALLYAAGADLDEKNGQGQTALHVACEAIDKDKARALLDIGADPNVANSFGRRPLDAVMDHYSYTYSYGTSDHNEIIGALLKAGASPGLSPLPEMKSAPLHIAARNGNVPSIRMLVSAGARLDQPDRTEAGLTPLHVAAEAGRFDAAMLLKDSGADPSRADNFGRGLLHFAARGGNTQLIAALVSDPAADIEVRDGRGRTPLHHACRKDKRAAAVALLKAGADPLAQDAEGLTPLHHAVMITYSPDVFGAFREALGDKADWDIPAADGDRLLHTAARHGQANSMQKLLELGADPGKAGRNGQLPLHAAVEQGNEWAIALLIEAMKKRSQSLDAEDAAGATPLHLAAARNDSGPALKLLAAGANINAAAEGGDTPLHVAARAGRDDIVRLLLLRGAEIVANAAGETAQALAAAQKRDYIARLIGEEQERRQPPKPATPAPKPPQP